MNYKKLLLPFLLVVMIAVSISAVSAADVASDDVATVAVSENQTYIQGIIDDTEEGGIATIPEGNYTNINYLTINKTITLKGDGDVNLYGPTAEQYPSGYVSIIQVVSGGDNVVIDGIKFYSLKSDGTYITGNMDGYGVEAINVENLTVQNCYFYDLNSGVSISGCTYTTIATSYFNGNATGVSGIGGYSGKEKGTKAVNIGGSTNTTVTGCTFEGWMLDAISMAKNAQICTVTNNVFIGNAYGFFFGGGVNYVTITSNKFYANSDSGKLTKQYIAAAKSCKDYVVSDNYFEVTNGTQILYAEVGNTAHGAATKCGPFSFTNNIINATEGTDASTAYAVLFYSNGGDFNPNGFINISDNDYSGAEDINKVLMWNTDWGTAPAIGGIPITNFVIGSLTTDEEGTVLYNLKSTKGTKIIMSDVSYNKGEEFTYTLTLQDTDGNPIADQTIVLYFNGESYEATTDADGVASYEGVEDYAGKYYVVAVFAGSETYDSSSAQSSVTIRKDTKIYANAAVINTKSSKYTATLKDENGKAIANKEVTLTIAGKTFKATTSSAGVATFAITGVTKTGAQNAVIIFSGDDTYTATTTTVKLTVKVQTTLTAPAVSIKAKKTGYLTITLKDINKKALYNKVVKITLNGKTYSVKTNKYGVAKLAIKMTTKKTYSAIVRYYGDTTYLPSSVSTKVRIY